MIKVGVDNIIVSKDLRVLLIKRSENSKNYPSCWGFVGGWMEDNELPHESLERESFEEIGVKTEKHQFVGKIFANKISDSNDTRIVLPHFATIAENSKVKLQKEEIQDYNWFTFDEALKLDWAYDHKQIFEYAINSRGIYKYLEIQIDQIIGPWSIFLDTIFKDLEKSNIDASQYELDHVAYRATTDTSFNQISEALSKVAKRINRNTIRNRFIDIFELETPLSYKGRSIKFVELTAPADGDTFNEGLEHVEFIINNISLADFVKKYHGLDWNLNAIDREIGPDIGIRLQSGYGAKFKTMSMAEIIRLESYKLT